MASARDRHLERMSEAFCEFRQSETLCDTTLVTKDRVILAHSVILASASDVFREAFQLSDCDSNGCYHFELESISGAVMETMLCLIYTGFLQVPREDPASLAVVMKACEQLGIRFTSSNLVSEMKDVAETPNLENTQGDAAVPIGKALETRREGIDPCGSQRDTQTSFAGFSGDVATELFEDTVDEDDDDIITEHTSPFVCDVCSEGFDAASALRCHRRLHSGCVDCTECGLCFQSRTALSEHLYRSCRASSVASHLCSKECIGRCSLADDAATEHSEDDVVCSRRCQPLSSTTLHQTSEEESSSSRFYVLICSCGLRCRNSVELAAHRSTSRCCGNEESSVQFCCCTCGQAFCKKKAVLHHLTVHGLVVDSNACNDEDLQLARKNCDAASKSSKTSKAGRHSLQNEMTLVSSRPTFDSRQRLEENDEIQQPPKNSRLLSCADCSKTFTRISDLQAHVRRHTGEMGYDCPVCGREFRKKNTLQRHIRVHTGERPYVCEVCGKSFKIMFHLQLHRSIHLTERAFTCSTCLKAFQSSVRLKKHAAVHSNVKPYFCPICSRAFNRNGNMRAHMKIHDVGDQGVSNSVAINVNETSSTEHQQRAYRCDECGNTFSRLSGLRSHYTRFHPESSPAAAAATVDEADASSAVQVVYCKRVDDQADDSFISMPITVHFSDDESSNFIC